MRNRIGPFRRRRKSLSTTISSISWNSSESCAIILDNLKDIHVITSISSSYPVTKTIQRRELRHILLTDSRPNHIELYITATKSHCKSANAETATYVLFSAQILFFRLVRGTRLGPFLSFFFFSVLGASGPHRVATFLLFFGFSGPPRVGPKLV